MLCKRLAPLQMQGQIVRQESRNLIFEEPRYHIYEGTCDEVHGHEESLWGSYIWSSHVGDSHIWQEWP